MTLEGTISKYQDLRLLVTSSKKISVMICETPCFKAGAYNFIGSSALISYSILEKLLDNYTVWGKISNVLIQFDVSYHAKCFGKENGGSICDWSSCMNCVSFVSPEEMLTSSDYICGVKEKRV
jgi:hypothetical protein